MGACAYVRWGMGPVLDTQASAWEWCGCRCQGRKCLSVVGWLQPFSTVSIPSPPSWSLTRHSHSLIPRSSRQSPHPTPLNPPLTRTPSPRAVIRLHKAALAAQRDYWQLLQMSKVTTAAMRASLAAMDAAADAAQAVYRRYGGTAAQRCAVPACSAFPYAAPTSDLSAALTIHAAMRAAHPTFASPRVPDSLSNPQV